MDWRQLLRSMRQQGWTVLVEDGWVDIETPTGGQGGFERSPKGLRQAVRFYQQYSAPSGYERRSIPRRASARSPHRSSYLVVTCGAFVLLVAMYHGVMVPPDRVACGVIMLLALVFIECTRRISHLW